MIEASNPAPKSSSIRRWPALLTLGLIAAILAAFAGLLPMSSWRPDEYHDFASFREEGWSFFMERLLTWSPRPLSEAIAGLYHLAILGTGRQLITPFLALLWLTLLVGPALWAWRAPPGRRLMRVVGGGAVLCFFLLGHEVAEVFFWPMGSLAYLPMLAAATALTFEVMDGRWQRGGGQGACVACLLCAAGSAEVGAILAIVFAAAMIGLHLAGAVGRRRDAGAWLWPLALGIVVMAMLALGRGRLEEHVSFRGVASNPTFLHHPLASAARSIPTYFRQLAILNAADAGAGALLFGAAVKVVMALGLTALLSTTARPASRGTRTVLLALAVSLQATLFLSIAGSYYKFGTLCCERHDEVRQCLLVLTVLCGAALAAPAWPRRAATLGPGLIGLTLLVLLVREAPALDGAYAAWTSTVRSRQANWAAGHSPGEQMTFLTPPVPPIVSGMVSPERGSFHLGDKNPWLWDLVMTYFDKRDIRLEPL